MRSILDLKKEKSGEITTNNVLSLIVAIIGIGILIFGIAKLYGIYSNNAERNVQKTLDNIVAKINALENGDRAEVLIQGFPQAKGWYLVGFGEGDSSIPDKCLFKSCLCACNGFVEESGLPEGFIGRVDSGSFDFQTEDGIKISKEVGNFHPQDYKYARLDWFSSTCQGNKDSGLGFCREVNRPELFARTVNKGEGAEIPYIKLGSGLIELIIRKSDEKGERVKERVEIFHDPFSLIEEKNE